MKKTILLAFGFLFWVAQAQAQLFVDNNYSIEAMIEAFFSDADVSISNVSYSGTQPSLAFFEGSQSNIGMNAGLLITTGEAQLAVGPNDSESAGANLQLPGSPWLDALIPGFYTHDAAVIEMDLVPNSDTLAFRYVFGSEEYLEYVGTSFNDLFAFLIDGPGLPSGDTIVVPADTLLSYNDCWICVDTIIPFQTVYCDSIFNPATNMWVDSCWVQVDTQYVYCYEDPNCVPDTLIYPGYSYISPGGTNIAQIPGTNLPVAINLLNQNSYTQYFIDNAGGQSVQYDGFTTPLWASIAVTAGETYHVRIAIADAGDNVFDSGVFLGIESMGGDSLLVVDPDFVANPEPGTKKVDFVNNTLWATQWHWDFGDGASSEDRYPSHTYDADGAYTVSLTASNWCSAQTITQQVQIGISSTSTAAKDVFSVKPNPASGYFVLDLKNSGNAPVRLMDTNGRLLLEGNYDDGARIDLSSFGKGVFVLQVLADGKVYTEKIINR